MKTLVYDLLLTEAWKEKVFPIIRNQIATVSSIRAYMAVSIYVSWKYCKIYHESTVTNILEVFLYHRTATESCEEALVELIDYCYRKFVNMVSKLEQMSDSDRQKQKL